LRDDRQDGLIFGVGVLRDVKDNYVVAKQGQSSTRIVLTDKMMRRSQVSIKSQAQDPTLCSLSSGFPLQQSPVLSLELGVVGRSESEVQVTIGDGVIESKVDPNLV
jgi:hypothetical protein